MGYSPFRATGLTHHDPARAFPGFTLFAPLDGQKVFLINMAGEVVHEWRPPAPWGSYYGYLLPTGNLLLRCVTKDQRWQIGGASGAVVELDWDGTVVWRYEDPALHHDHCRLANGNTMLLYWEALPEALTWQVQGGIPGTGLDGGNVMLGDALREVDAQGRTVWEWHSFTALDPKVDLICPLEARREWTHCNAVEELADGTLVVSARATSTVYILDRTTGQFRWHWGPGILSHQHDPTPVGDDHLLMFDNGEHRKLSLPHSLVVEVDIASGNVVWQYAGAPRASFFSTGISGAQRLPNGNTLICEGRPGRLFEVTPEGQIVWEYINPFTTQHGEAAPGSAVFRAHRYAADSPEIRGRA